MTSLAAIGVIAAIFVVLCVLGPMIVLLLGLTGLIMRSANIALAASDSEHARDTLKPKV